MENLVVLDSLVAGAQAAKEFAAGLFSTFAQTTVNALKEMDAVKADKAQGMTTAIPTTGWTMEPGQDLQYPYYYDITAQVTAVDRADIIIETACLQDARTCGFCPTVETINGKIRVRAQQVPGKEIRAQCWITKGVTK